MSAMGLYQVCPGDPVYQLTAPVFSEVIIQPVKSDNSGKKFIIRADGLDDKNIYIRSATLNGKPFNRYSITHAVIERGGELVYKMGNEPDKKWGTE